MAYTQLNIDCGIDCSQLLHPSLFGAGFFTHRSFLCRSFFLCLFLSLLTFLFSFLCYLPDLSHKFFLELEKAGYVHWRCHSRVCLWKSLEAIQRRVEVGRTWSSAGPSPAQAGSPGGGCLAPWPDHLGIAPLVEIPQSPWVTCSSSQALSQQKCSFPQVLQDSESYKPTT